MSKEIKFWGNNLCQEDGTCFRFCDRLYVVDDSGNLFSASIEDLKSVEDFGEYNQLPYEGYRFFQPCRVSYYSKDFKTVLRLGITQCYDVATEYYADSVRSLALSSDGEDEWLRERIEQFKKHLDNLNKLMKTLI